MKATTASIGVDQVIIGGPKPQLSDRSIGEHRFVS